MQYIDIFCLVSETLKTISEIGWLFVNFRQINSFKIYYSI